MDNGATKCWGNTNRICALPFGTGTGRGNSASGMGDNLPEVNFGTGRTARQIAIGGNAGCALLDNGAVKCWGRSDLLGQGTASGSCWGDAANEVGDNWPATDLGSVTVVAITAGHHHFCALLNTARLRCWGEGNRGQLGTGSTSSPIGDTSSEMGSNLVDADIGGLTWWSDAWGTNPGR